jgi:hypothetical protein
MKYTLIILTILTTLTPKHAQTQEIGIGSVMTVGYVEIYPETTLYAWKYTCRGRVINLTPDCIYLQPNFVVFKNTTFIHEYPAKTPTNDCLPPYEWTQFYAETDTLFLEGAPLGVETFMTFDVVAASAK